MTWSVRLGITAQIAGCLLLASAALRHAGIQASLSHEDFRHPRIVAKTPRGPFPRMAEDAFGRPLVLQSPPSRLGSQTLTTDEFLFSVVPTEKIVIVSQYATDEAYSHVLSEARAMDLGFATDPEAVALRSPELLLVSHTANANYVRIVEAAGTRAFRMLTIVEELDHIAEGLELTGHISGEDSAAAREVQALRERIRAARERRSPGSDPVRVLAFSSLAHTYGQGSLFDHILRQLGAVNVAAENGIGQYASISGEQVADWNPDWIVAAFDSGRKNSALEDILSDPGVAVTTAGRREQVLLLESRLYHSMSQHVVGMMEQIAAAIYTGGDHE